MERPNNYIKIKDIITTKFLYLPKCINGETRWWVTATYKSEASYTFDVTCGSESYLILDLEWVK